VALRPRLSPGVPLSRDGRIRPTAGYEGCQDGWAERTAINQRNSALQLRQRCGRSWAPPCKSASRKEGSGVFWLAIWPESLAPPAEAA
jgi:hypothetical protein